MDCVKFSSFFLIPLKEHTLLISSRVESRRSKLRDSKVGKVGGPPESVRFELKWTVFCGKEDGPANNKESERCKVDGSGVKWAAFRKLIGYKL